MAFGSVSTATFTRAEIDTMLKKAMYSEGKVVWSGIITVGYNYGGSITVPDTVDYIIVNGVKIARGGSAVVDIAPATVQSCASNFTFGSNGNITATAHYNNAYVGVKCNCTGYHYY